MDLVLVKTKKNEWDIMLDNIKLSSIKYILNAKMKKNFINFEPNEEKKIIYLEYGKIHYLIINMLLMELDMLGVNMISVSLHYKDMREKNYNRIGFDFEKYFDDSKQYKIFTIYTNSHNRSFPGDGDIVNLPFPFHSYFMKSDSLNMAKKIKEDASNPLITSSKNATILETKDGQNDVFIRNFPENYLFADGLSNYFTEYARIFANTKNKIAPYNAWLNTAIQEQIRSEIAKWYDKNNMSQYSILEYNRKIAYEYSELLYRKNATVNIFNPTFGVYAINELIKKDGKILDPSAGWGDRLIAAFLSHADSYQGYEPNKLLQCGYKNCMHTLQMDPEKYKVIFESFLTAKVATNFYDLVLTSPPFFDLEIYSTSTTQSTFNNNTYEQWLKNFYTTYLQRACDSLVIGGKIALYVSNYFDKKIIPFEMDSKNIIEEYGCVFVRKIYFRQDYAGKEGEIRPLYVWEKKIQIVKTFKFSAKAPEFFIEPNILETPNLFLRKFTLNDISLMSDIFANSNVMKTIANGRVKTLQETKVTIERYIAEYQKETYGQFYPIIRTTDNVIIGLIGYYTGDFNHQYLKNKKYIRIIIDESYQSRGYAKEIVNAFVILNNNKDLYAMVDINNTNSNKLFSKYRKFIFPLEVVDVVEENKTDVVHFNGKDYYLYILVDPNIRIKAFFSERKEAFKKEIFQPLLDKYMKHIELVDTWEKANLIWKITSHAIDEKKLPLLQSINVYPRDLIITDKAQFNQTGIQVFGLKKFYSDIHPFTLTVNTINDNNKKSSLIREQINEHPSNLWIIKESSGSQGKGTYVVNQQEILDTLAKTKNNYVLQHYIANPMLLDGYKFDLRFFMVVNNPDIYLYTNFPIRVADQKYTTDTLDNKIHLTNISLSGRSEHTDRRFNNVPQLQQYREKLINYAKDIKVLFGEKILGKWSRDTIKTYQVFGVDIFLTENGKPYILEINLNTGGNDEITGHFLTAMFNIAFNEPLDYSKWMKL